MPTDPSSLVPLGYWWSRDEPDLPDPGRFVDPTWDAGERRRVVAYLRGAPVLARSPGFAFCRFRCGQAAGSAEQSDGRFRWPDGLVHYVEAHAVRLPAAFVDHALGRGGGAPVAADWWRRQEGFGGAERSFRTDGQDGRVVLALAPDAGTPDAAVLRFVRTLVAGSLGEIRQHLAAGGTYTLPLDYGAFTRLAPPTGVVARFEE